MSRQHTISRKKNKINRLGRGAAVVAAAVVGVFWGTGAVRAEEGKDTFLYEAQGRRDPFLPLITPSGYLVNLDPETDETLRLEGIMFDPSGDSIAIINGELLRVGESLGDAVIIDIKAQKVTVMRNNETLELELRREAS